MCILSLLDFVTHQLEWNQSETCEEHDEWNRQHHIHGEEDGAPVALP
jgi:hypothetical protein